MVFHSAVLSYVSPDQRRAFAAVLAEASRRREVVWVSNEGAGIIGELAVLAPSAERAALSARAHAIHERERDTASSSASPTLMEQR